MNAADSHIPARGADLLLEHVASLDPVEYQGPTARERLERIVGGYLARMLVGALSSGRRHRRRSID
jgi:hypothetical protein